MEDAPTAQSPPPSPIAVDAQEPGAAPSPAEDVPPSPPHPHVTIEDVDDEDAGPPRPSNGKRTGATRYVVDDPADDLRAGKSLGVDATVFERVQEEQEEQGQDRYGPLQDAEVMEVAEFLVDCVGKGEADRFLKMARVRTASLRCRSSFHLRLTLRFRYGAMLSFLGRMLITSLLQLTNFLHLMLLCDARRSA
jgi:hypothetical protein